jgi:glycosyltransferase involved in cell wall biosynthesis
MPVERPPVLVCASTQYWEEAWFRKHYFMDRLARSRPVVYVEPSRSILRPPPRGAPEALGNPWIRPRLRRVQDRLWVWTPPRGLPFWTHAGVSGPQYRYYGALLRRAVRSLGFERSWLWLYNPLYVQAVDALGAERLIFDLVDDLGAYEARVPSRATMQRCVAAAIDRADLVLTTSPLLARDHASRRPKDTIHVVPNGVRGDWIGRAPARMPEEVARLPRPRIGFAGALFGYLDYGILRACARAFPQGSLALLGPIRDAAAVETLAAEPNVHVLGARPQAEVPDYVAAFDVCVCPFREGAVRRAVNPLKVYEYLALGRPVVATPLESLEGEAVAKVIRFASGPEGFVAEVRAALATDTPEAQAERRAVAGGYAWEVLSERVAGILSTAEAAWKGYGPD